MESLEVQSSIPSGESVNKLFGTTDQGTPVEITPTEAKQAILGGETTIANEEKVVMGNVNGKSGTGYADTDLIQLYANNGTPNGKISRTDMMACVRTSLGTLLNASGADQSINGAKIPSINSSGVLGSMTAENLARLLGSINLTRRTRLTSFSLSTLQSAVADQNLEKYGLRVGDYTTINGRTYVIAGLNPMKGASTPYRLTTNHVGLIVIPHTTQKWNESGNTYTGADNRGAGYLNSDLHYYLENTLLPLVKTDLGSSNLLSHSKLLSNAVNTTGYNKRGEASGCSSGWTWESDCYISALSEVQVYGATVWSSSGYDTGEACRQLDVFRHFNHTEIFGGEYPWLRDVVSASFAAGAVNRGYADYSTASYAIHVAALILFH